MGMSLQTASEGGTWLADLQLASALLDCARDEKLLARLRETDVWPWPVVLIAVESVGAIVA